MKVQEILLMDLVTDNTEIFIRNQNFGVLTQGKWYQKNVSGYLGYVVEGFTWQDDDKVYIDLKSL
ncbi:MAG: hypothetical protein [Bacteriophage sp.]|nr:MAG: hypothetical protein [Bacteriophage sp.]